MSSQQKISEKKIEAIREALLQGLPVSEVAFRVGTSLNTVYKYGGDALREMQQARERERVELRYAEALERAKIAERQSQERQEAQREHLRGVMARAQADLEERERRSKYREEYLINKYIAKEREKAELREERRREWLLRRALNFVTEIEDVEMLDDGTCLARMGESLIRLNPEYLANLEKLFERGAVFKETDRGLVMRYRDRTTKLLRLIAHWWNPRAAIGHRVSPLNGDYNDCRRENIRISESPAELAEKRRKAPKRRGRPPKPRKPGRPPMLRKPQPQAGSGVRPTGDQPPRYQAFIRFGSNDLDLGIFESEVEAARAYNAAANRFSGSKARLNSDC
jgi:transposase-like protein